MTVTRVKSYFYLSALSEALCLLMDSLIVSYLVQQCTGSVRFTEALLDQVAVELIELRETTAHK